MSSDLVCSLVVCFVLFPLTVFVSIFARQEELERRSQPWREPGIGWMVTLISAVGTAFGAWAVVGSVPLTLLTVAIPGAIYLLGKLQDKREERKKK